MCSVCPTPQRSSSTTQQRSERMLWPVLVGMVLLAVACRSAEPLGSAPPSTTAPPASKPSSAAADKTPTKPQASSDVAQNNTAAAAQKPKHSKNASAEALLKRLDASIAF
ncbi:MAG: hypothetical protein AAFS10_22290, partial [Myxococcota bacterium]